MPAYPKFSPTSTMCKWLQTYFFLLLLLSSSICSVLDNEIDDILATWPRISRSLKEEIQGYQPVVNKIVNEILHGKYAGDTHQSLQRMTDLFGARLAGSEELERSIDYMVDQFKAAGLENVHTEEAPVSHWIRGDEFGMLVSPRHARLPILGLGTTVGTPDEGIEADVVAVESFEELEKMPASKVEGKIVVFVPSWKGYGTTVQYRSKGASAAARKGAVASLIRSITPFSIGSLHTGGNNYESDVRKIPTASITVEDAEMILRLYRSGEQVRISLKMSDYNLAQVKSRNTIGEVTGTLHKNESVVVVSGHLDSWDVGVGAMDDGGGAFISWKALQYLKDMGLRPKRTMRAILWTGEEFGYQGARAYEAFHKKNEKDEFNFFMESDTGTFEPYGLGFSGNKAAAEIVKQILGLMTPINATTFEFPSDGGPDISLWVRRGFPGASLLNKNERYFWFHHSAGDSMLVEDPVNLDKCTALFAATAYVIADLSVNIPRDVE